MVSSGDAMDGDKATRDEHYVTMSSLPPIREPFQSRSSFGRAQAHESLLRRRAGGEWKKNGLLRTASERHCFAKGSPRERDSFVPARRGFGHERSRFGRSQSFSGGFRSGNKYGLKSVITKESTQDLDTKGIGRDGFGIAQGERKSPRLSLKSSLGSERDGRREMTEFSPRKRFQLESKGIGWGRTSIRQSPVDGKQFYQDCFYREVEKFSYGKRKDRESSYRRYDEFFPGRCREKEYHYKDDHSSYDNSQEKEHADKKRGHACTDEEKSVLEELATMTTSDKADEGSHFRNFRKRGHEDRESHKHAESHYCEKKNMHRRSIDDYLSSFEEKMIKDTQLHILKQSRSDRERHRLQDAARYQAGIDNLVAIENSHKLESGGGSEVGEGKLTCLRSPLFETGSREKDGDALESSLKGDKKDRVDQLAGVSINQDNCQATETSHVSLDISEMEEGEVEPDGIRISEGMEEPLEHLCHADAETDNFDDKTVSSIRTLEDQIKNKHNWNSDFESMIEVKAMPLQQTCEEVSSAALEINIQACPSERQSFATGRGASKECRGTNDYDCDYDDGNIQQERAEVNEICPTSELEIPGETKLDCKASETLYFHFHKKEEGYKGLTLDVGQLTQENEGFLESHLKATGENELERIGYFDKELTLPLSISMSDMKEKDSDWIKLGRSKEPTLQLETTSDNLKPGPSEQGLAGNEFLQSTELSCETQKEKRLKLEDSLQLSLALPDTSHILQVPALPQLGKTVQSFGQTCTDSDAFTTSLSFSPPLLDNPSCFLTHTSLGNQECSYDSQQISQGNEHTSHGSWQTPLEHGKASCVFTEYSHERSKPWQDASLYRRLLQSGAFQSPQRCCIGNKGSSLNERSCEKVTCNQASQDGFKTSQRLNTAEESTDERAEKPGKVEKESHTCKEQSMSPHVVQFSSDRSIRFQERDVRRHHIYLQRTEQDLENEQSYSANDEDRKGIKCLDHGKVELLEVVTQPVAVVAQKLQKLSDSSLEGLKAMMKELLQSIEKREEFMNLQKILTERRDLTEETLHHAHRTQLELLLALKMGLQAFINPDCESLTDKALIEIFLHLRCRNFYCQTPLPVDGCDCKVCSKNNGFCNACMCSVCLKFDFEAKTCRWIGCNYCLHWCHTDCGLWMSYIVPASSIEETTKNSGMQFRCLACSRNSELFGFVKDVFTNFGNEWNAEILAKELDCVRRIFHGSEDTREKQLCRKAEEMLQKLENDNGTREVYRNVLSFFSGSNVKIGAYYSHKPFFSFQGTSNLWESMLNISPCPGNKLPGLDRRQVVFQTYNCKHEEKVNGIGELQRNRAQEKSEINELERMVRIKLAESKMLQGRADEARQEAKGLQHIVAVKCQKIDEEYSGKLIKLQLNEVEQRRRKQFEELQLLERAQTDYHSMKVRMEEDVDGLLKRLEAQAANFIIAPSTVAVKRR